MRFTRVCKIVLSEDDTTTPKKLRFSEDLETLDNGGSAILKDGGGSTITIPANTTGFALPMPQITTGKYLYLYGSVAFTLQLQGEESAEMSLLASKANELWFNFTDAPLITTGETALRLTYAIAGD